MINLKFKYHLVFILMVLGSFTLFGQDKTNEGKIESDTTSLDAMSLEQLMNIPISSASKKNETLFDAPLSSYTITKEDIAKSGVTSIMEALRLAPGVIVREETNGVYDIHIRGFDNGTRNQRANAKSNFATLVMIDDRPVFNAINGGTDWEALPISLIDIERIEIVRGPSAALFGPNAVSGVVNIITSKAKGEKLNVSADVQSGTSGTQIGNLLFGKKIGNWNFGLSANAQKRDRFDSKYYSIIQNEYVSASNLILFKSPQATIYLGDAGVAKEIPNPEIALNRFGVNSNIGFKKDDKFDFSLSFGTTHSEVQKIYSTSAPDTYFGTPRTQSYYTGIKLNVSNFKFRGSYYNTLIDPDPAGQSLGSVVLVTKSDYTYTDIVTEYDVNVNKKIKITPGLGFQEYSIDDTPYHDNTTSIGLFNGNHSIQTLSSYLRSDLSLSSKLRILGSVRFDKFSVPDKTYLNYELASTYSINNSNLIRFAITRSNSGSFFRLNYTDLIIGGVKAFTGNQNLKQFTIDMIEIGFRSKLSNSIHLDLDLFNQKGYNFSVDSPTPTASGAGTYANSPLELFQYGLTASLNFVPTEKFQIKPFVTFQKTTSENPPASFIGTSTHTNTPEFYGGYYLNYKANEKMNLNLNGYYFASQRQYDRNDPTNTNPQGDISGKVLVNFKVSYLVAKGWSVYLNARNGLNSRSREFYAADQTKGVYLIGMNLLLN